MKMKKKTIWIVYNLLSFIHYLISFLANLNKFAVVYNTTMISNKI